LIEKEDKSKDSEEEFPVYDMSHVRNKLLLSSIVTTSPPDLYFLGWLGYETLMKLDIGIYFEEFNRNYAVFQAYTNLTQIRVNKKRYDLLEPVRKGYQVKRHNIDASVITLSTMGYGMYYSPFLKISVSILNLLLSFSFHIFSLAILNTSDI
jgi:hypothetical protein